MALHLTDGGLFLLLWVAAAALAWLTYRRTRPAASARTTLLLIALRVAALSLLLLVLSEPVLERWTRRVARPGVLLLVDTSSSMALAEDDTTRFRRIQRVLTDDEFTASLGDVDVHGWRFDAEAVPLDLDTVASVVPIGRATDIAAGLNTALEQTDGRSQVQAVVVLSDGRHNLGPDPVEAAASAGVPVYALIVGSDRHPPDVQIAPPTPPESAYVGQEFVLEAGVRAWGYSARPAVVGVEEDGEQLAERRIVLGRDGAITRVDLRIRPRTAGTHVYRVHVSGLTDEATLENNEVVVPVDVREKRLRVLIVGSAPSPDLAFVDRILRADSTLTVDIRDDLLRSADTSGLADVWARVTDCDVLVAVDPGSVLLQGEFSRHIRAWVEQGGALFWIFGPHTLIPWTPEDHSSFLPVALPHRPGWRAEPLTVHLTAAGMRHPIGRGSEHAGHTDPWLRLPPLPGYVPVRKVRPGSVVILEGSFPDRVPVIVAGHRGRGRVVVALSAGFWRQEMLARGAGQSTRALRALWRNSVHWLSTHEVGARLRVWSAHRVYRSGARLSFRGQLTDEFLRPQEGARVNVRISPGKIVIPLIDQGAGNYEASWHGLEPGKYTFIAMASSQGDSVGQDRGSFIVEPYSLESLDLKANPETLERMAQVSGGVALPVAEWRTLLTRLPLEKRVIRTRTVAGLWPHTWCLGAVVVLLLAEWVVRKRNGMI